MDNGASMDNGPYAINCVEEVPNSGQDLFLKMPKETESLAEQMIQSKREFAMIILVKLIANLENMENGPNARKNVEVVLKPAQDQLLKNLKMEEKHAKVC